MFLWFFSFFPSISCSFESSYSAKLRSSALCIGMFTRSTRLRKEDTDTKGLVGRLVGRTVKDNDSMDLFAQVLRACTCWPRLF